MTYDSDWAPDSSKKRPKLTPKTPKMEFEEYLRFEEPNLVPVVELCLVANHLVEIRLNLHEKRIVGMYVGVHKPAETVGIELIDSWFSPFTSSETLEQAVNFVQEVLDPTSDGSVYGDMWQCLSQVIGHLHIFHRVTLQEE